MGNYIGTNAAGNATIANAADGVDIIGATNDTIGGTSMAARNVISGNTVDGILITGSTATGNVVEGNYIGTDSTGTAALANHVSGVYLVSGANNNIIGGPTAAAGNVLSGNTYDGISIIGSGTSGNEVENNYIGTNAAGTAALANHNQVRRYLQRRDRQCHRRRHEQTQPHLGQYLSRSGHLHLRDQQQHSGRQLDRPQRRRHRHPR